jgi:hypothetical protein
MHSGLNFKEQAKFKNIGAREKGLDWRPSLIRNTWNSAEIVSRLYRTIAFNKRIQELYNQNPKGKKELYQKE